MITVAGATFQTDKVFVGVLIFAVAGLIGTELIGKNRETLRTLAAASRCVISAIGQAWHSRLS
jgi:ABC-type nitrate/sulfonate/bicarbonate transport system permease component